MAGVEGDGVGSAQRHLVRILGVGRLTDIRAVKTHLTISYGDPCSIVSVRPVLSPVGDDFTLALTLAFSSGKAAARVLVDVDGTVFFGSHVTVELLYDEPEPQQQEPVATVVTSHAHTQATHVPEGYHAMPEGRYPIPEGYRPIPEGCHPVPEGYRPVPEGRHPIREGYGAGSSSPLGMAEAAERCSLQAPVSMQDYLRTAATAYRLLQLYGVKTSQGRLLSPKKTKDVTIPSSKLSQLVLAALHLAPTAPMCETAIQLPGC